MPIKCRLKYLPITLPILLNTQWFNNFKAKFINNTITNITMAINLEKLSWEKWTNK